MFGKTPFLENKKQLLLGQEKINGFGEDTQKIRKRRIQNWYRVYLVTTLIVIGLTLVIFLAFTTEKISFRGFSDKLAQSLLQGGFGERETVDTDKPDTVLPETDKEPESEPDTEEKPDDIPAGVVTPDTDTPDINTEGEGKDAPTLEELYNFDYSRVPEGETAIIPMDLSLSSSGVTYINNSTGYTPDAEALLAAKLGGGVTIDYLSTVREPVVLIVHTHATEAFSEEEAISYRDDGGELARSHSSEENVVSLGALMAEVLNEKGIETLHCAVMHDSIQYKDSYARAEETIRQYLEKYPSIKLVIDLHRDAVIKSTGELVRPVTLVDGEAAAQVMCVVGSDWGGDACPNWQNNLSLALKLREKLNLSYGNLCRPTDLRSATYNQELSEYSLLLEIGACGNSLREAKISAELVALALAELIPRL